MERPVNNERSASKHSSGRRALFLRPMVAALSAAALPKSVAARGFPNRTVTLIVPNPAGGEADHLARRIAKALVSRLGQAVVVENVGGASGALAAKRVLRAVPDGYTLLFGTTSDMVVTPIGSGSLGYAAGDFTPVAKLGSTPMTLVSRTGLQAESTDSLVSMARKAPGALSIGTTGERSLQAFAAAALARAARIDLTRIPYRGGAALLQDLASTLR